MRRCALARATALCASTLAVVIISSVAAPSAAPAQEPPHVLIERHAEELGLDAETLEAIVDTARASRAQHQLLLAEVQRARAELQLLLQAEEPDVALVMDAIEVLGAAEVALRQLDVRTLITMRSMLTAEQREALAELAGDRLGAPGPPPPGAPPHGAPHPGGRPPGSMGGPGR